MLDERVRQLLKEFAQEGRKKLQEQLDSIKREVEQLLKENSIVCPRKVKVHNIVREVMEQPEMTKKVNHPKWIWRKKQQPIIAQGEFPWIKTRRARPTHRGKRAKLILVVGTEVMNYYTTTFGDLMSAGRYIYGKAKTEMHLRGKISLDGISMTDGVLSWNVRRLDIEETKDTRKGLRGELNGSFG